MEVGLVKKIDIDDEMQQAYLDYAMSVIVARALPDARDGLKPVHRRILYAMYDMGLRTDSAYKKSARIVGEVLGKYHPHGDMAVYDAMARMAQDFSMRYLLVDGQGNFGSVDGDPPAAMRYTEARLAAPSLNMLADINKNTVDFEDNFDGTLAEPGVLPAALPNLLVNGATGIAVGMSTSIPPHNLGEVVDALRYMLENWGKLDDIDVEHLMSFIQGPDFPTGGIIIQEAEGDGLMSAYGTGRGRVIVRARVHLEEMERSRNRIIVTELPYMTNKSSLIERIAELVREERLEGIVDLRDESDRHGMRIVIELSKNVDPEKVLSSLYKYTPMQSTFSLIMLALVDGEPRMLSLKQALRVYIEHRLEIIRRRSEYDLERARQRAHILEGLRVALKNLDEVIEMIRKAPDVDTARARLMKRFKLTDIQAQAILDMPLRRLAALERKKIEEEYKEVQALIKELESLLRSPARMRQVVSDELQAVKEAFGDARRTQILHLKEGDKKISLLTASDLTPQKTIWLSVTREGLISRSPDEKQPRPVGKDAPVCLVQASTRDTVYLVCEQGEAAAIAVHTIPEVQKPSEGTSLSKVSALRDGNRLAAIFTLPPKGERPEDHFILTVTRNGMVKKTALSELPGPASGTFALVRVNEGDRLVWLRVSNGQSEILLATARGMAIRFNEEEVRPMGLVAAGVMGIKLQAADEVAGMELLPKPGDVFLLASDGSAKRVPVDQFPQQGRYGQGIQAWKLSEKAQVAGMAVGRGALRAIIHLEKSAPKTIRLDEAPLVSRVARGSQIIKEAKSGDRITGLTVAHAMAGPGSSGPSGDGSDDSEGPNGKAARSRVKSAQAARSAGTTPKARQTTSVTQPNGSETRGTRSRAKAAPPSGSPKSKATKEQPKAVAKKDNAGMKASPGRTKAAAEKSRPADRPAASRTKAASEKRTAGTRTQAAAPVNRPENRPAKAASQKRGTGTKTSTGKSTMKTKEVPGRTKAAKVPEKAASRAQKGQTKTTDARPGPVNKATRGQAKAASGGAAPAVKTTKGRAKAAAEAPASESKVSRSRAKTVKNKAAEETKHTGAQQKTRKTPGKSPDTARKPRTSATKSTPAAPTSRRPKKAGN